MDQDPPPGTFRKAAGSSRHIRGGLSRQSEVLAAHILPGAPPGSVPRAAQLGLSYIVGYKQADPQYLNECVCC